MKKSLADSLREFKASLASFCRYLIEEPPLGTITISLSLLLSYLLSVRFRFWEYPPKDFLYSNGLSYWNVISGNPQSILTHFMVHISLRNLLRNLIPLSIFSAIIERRLGPLRTIVLFLGTGFIVGFIHLIIKPCTLYLGSSGIVFTFMVLASMIEPNPSLPLAFLLPLILDMLEAPLTLIQPSFSPSGMYPRPARSVHVIGGSLGFILAPILDREILSRKNARRTLLVVIALIILLYLLG